MNSKKEDTLRQTTKTATLFDVYSVLDLVMGRHAAMYNRADEIKAALHYKMRVEQELRKLEE